MAGILEINRTKSYLGELDRVVDWEPIEELLQKDYPVRHLSKASEHDTNYFPSVALRGRQGKKMPPKVYADKGYCSQDNREFLHMNQMADVIPHCKINGLGA
jgi:hypothetical protein